jgi:hypothetical protein
MECRRRGGARDAGLVPILDIPSPFEYQICDVARSQRHAYDIYIGPPFTCRKSSCLYNPLGRRVGFLAFNSMIEEDTCLAARPASLRHGRGKRSITTYDPRAFLISLNAMAQPPEIEIIDTPKEYVSTELNHYHSSATTKAVSASRTGCSPPTLVAQFVELSDDEVLSRLRKTKLGWRDT